MKREMKQKNRPRTVFSYLNRQDGGLSWVSYHERQTMFKGEKQMLTRACLEEKKTGFSVRSFGLAEMKELFYNPATALFTIVYKKEKSPVTSILVDKSHGLGVGYMFSRDSVIIAFCEMIARGKQQIPRHNHLDLDKNQPNSPHIRTILSVYRPFSHWTNGVQLVLDSICLWLSLPQNCSIDSRLWGEKQKGQVLKHLTFEKIHLKKIHFRRIPVLLFRHPR